MQEQRERARAARLSGGIGQGTDVRDDDAFD
jgi:hypothetical protein